MNKAELINALASKTGKSQKEAKAFLEGSCIKISANSTSNSFTMSWKLES